MNGIGILPLCAGQEVYEWEQSLEDVTGIIRPPASVAAAHLEVAIAAASISVGLKGNPPFLAAKTFATIDTSLSTWTFGA